MREAIFKACSQRVCSMQGRVVDSSSDLCHCELQTLRAAMTLKMVSLGEVRSGQEERHVKPHTRNITQTSHLGGPYLDRERSRESSCSLLRILSFVIQFILKSGVT